MAKKTENTKTTEAVQTVTGNTYFDQDAIKIQLQEAIIAVTNTQDLLAGRKANADDAPKDVVDLTDTVTTTQYNQLQAIVDRVTSFREAIVTKLDKVAVKVHRAENKDATASKRLEAKKAKLAKLHAEIAEMEKE